MKTGCDFVPVFWPRSICDRHVERSGFLRVRRAAQAEDTSSRGNRTTPAQQVVCARTPLARPQPARINVALPRLFVDFAPDQHAADLAGSGADLVELGVAQQPAGREVVDIAVAAEALDGLQRHPGRPFGGVEDGAGGVFAGDAAFVA